MTPRAKRLPRLWCALQGLLPLEACLAAQRAELALPPETGPATRPAAKTRRNRIADVNETLNVPARGTLRNKS